MDTSNLYRKAIPTLSSEGSSPDPSNDEEEQSRQLEIYTTKTVRGEYQTKSRSEKQEEDNFYTERFATLSTSEMIKAQYYNFIMIGASFLTILISALVRGGEGRPSIV